MVRSSSGSAIPTWWTVVASTATYNTLKDGRAKAASLTSSRGGWGRWPQEPVRRGGSGGPVTEDAV